MILCIWLEQHLCVNPIHICSTSMFVWCNFHSSIRWRMVYSQPYSVVGVHIIFSKSDSLVYMDNLKMFNSLSQTLQDDLDKICEWSSGCLFQVNCDKCCQRIHFLSYSIQGVSRRVSIRRLLRSIRRRIPKKCSSHTCFFLIHISNSKQLPVIPERSVYFCFIGF